MDAFLHEGPRAVPGPLALAVEGTGDDAVLWAAGGGHGESSVLRNDAQGWRSYGTRANGLRAVLPLGDGRAMIAGELGYLAVIDHAGEVHRVIRTDTRGCLYSLAAIGDHVWVTGDEGYLAIVTRSLELQRRHIPSSDRVTRALVGPHGQLWLINGTRLLEQGSGGGFATVFTARGELTCAAYAPDGTRAITGDGGQLYLVAPGQAPTPCALPSDLAKIDVEHVAFDAARDRFLVLGERGFVGALARSGGLVELARATPAYRLTSCVAWRGGHVVSGWTQRGVPCAFRGALYALDLVDPPSRVCTPPRQDFGPPRVRTIGLRPSGRRVLGAEDREVIALAEAKRRMTGVSWPDCPFDEVRFYDGDVHVRDAEALLDDHGTSGYAVAIRGDLIVDGPLDATAGGDGYGSVLVVQGDAWAQAALFRFGIVASFSGTLEVATVVLCDHGDDGGMLWAGAIRAQVLAYSTYFPKPECPIDAFCIGDVYGEASFPPERAEEVFIAEVLERGGFDEPSIVERLRKGQPVLREA